MLEYGSLQGLSAGQAADVHGRGRVTNGSEYEKNDYALSDCDCDHDHDYDGNGHYGHDDRDYGDDDHVHERGLLHGQLLHLQARSEEHCNLPHPA